ncbi:MAG: phosphomannomutase/phosphoglucomutase, partial [Rhodanobacter sp.]
MAISITGSRLRGLQIDWRHQLPLAGGTLLLLVGLFCAWQTWLIANESNAIEHVHAAQNEAVQALIAEIASERGSVMKVLAAADPNTLMSDPVKAAAALRQQLPQAKKLELYSGDLSEVLHANYREFGYAKAAQLMAAQSVDGMPPAQSVSFGNGDRRLSLVIPLGSPSQVKAWAWVELPFAPLQQRFESISPAGGRLDLRQGNERGDLQLLSNGAGSAEAEKMGKPVAGSLFSVGAGLPGAFIVLPRSWLLSALLTLLGLGGGMFLLWLRTRLREPSTLVPEELALPERIENTRTLAEPTPPVVAKPPAPPVTAAPAVDPSIFRAYDVRGVVGKTLNKDVARALGQSIGTLMGEKGLREIVIGRDGRMSGPELAGALSDGLRAAGIDVIDVGAVPTPVVYYAAYRFNTGCGVAVTGSHNPPDYNGFKIVVGGETLAEGAIQDLYQRIASGALESGGQGSLRQVDVGPDYLEKIVSDVLAERSLKIVVDCGNGIPGALAPQVLEGVGCE